MQSVTSSQGQADTFQGRGGHEGRRAGVLLSPPSLTPQAPVLPFPALLSSLCPVPCPASALYTAQSSLPGPGLLHPTLLPGAGSGPSLSAPALSAPCPALGCGRLERATGLRAASSHSWVTATNSQHSPPTIHCSRWLRDSSISLHNAMIK